MFHLKKYQTQCINCVDIDVEQINNPAILQRKTA